MDLDMTNKVNEHQSSTVFYNMIQEHVKTGQQGDRWAGFLYLMGLFSAWAK